MKQISKSICLLLAVLMLLSGCDGAAQTTAPTTAPTEPAPTAPEIIDTEEALRQAMENSRRVTLGGDIRLTQSLGVNGQILDGGGYTITGMEYIEEDATTENALEIRSGTVQNLNIQGAYRCIGDSKEYPLSQEVRIKNVNAEGTLLAMGISKGDGKGVLYVEDCTLRGWTLVNKLAKVVFTDCTFGWNTQGNAGHFRNFVDTTLINCRFETKVDKNGKQIPFNITFYETTKGVILTLEDCYVGDTLITQDNISQLLKLTLRNNRVVVHNTTQ